MTIAELIKGLQDTHKGSGLPAGAIFNMEVFLPNGKPVTDAVIRFDEPEGNYEIKLEGGDR